MKVLLLGGKMSEPWGHELQYFSSPAYRKEIWQRAESVDFWLGLNPKMHITEQPLVGCSGFALSEVDSANCASTLKEDGYLQTSPVVPLECCRLLSETILCLIDKGVHPLFAMVYDEYWKVLQNCTFFVRKLTDLEFCVVADFWVWAVNPNYAQSGWGPHRDNQYTKPFFEDGRPKVINLWIALTDSDATNGCIYVLPKTLDTNIPLHPEIQTVEDVQHIMALPAPVGSILGWDQHLLHWGGRCTKYAKNPRISFACYFQERHCDLRPDLMLNSTSILSLEERLSYIGQAFLRYDHSFQFPQELLEFARRFFNKYEFSKINDIGEFKKIRNVKEEFGH